MALGCGAFGPPLIYTKKTEKEWPAPPNPEWFVKQFHMKDIVETSLFISLFSKFYGAEYIEDNGFESLEGILAPYISGYIDPVEMVRQIRDPLEYD